MAGSLLEPSSLLRAAKRRSIAITEPTAIQICALLEVSRGITLSAPRKQGRPLARAIISCAVEAGAARGVFEVKPDIGVADIVMAANSGHWLLLEDLPAQELERLLSAVANLISAERDSRSAGVPKLGSSWRAVLAHEPTPDQMLPPIRPDLRRHFPLVEIAEGE